MLRVIAVGDKGESLESRAMCECIKTIINSCSVFAYAASLARKFQSGHPFKRLFVCAGYVCYSCIVHLISRYAGYALKWLHE